MSIASLNGLSTASLQDQLTVGLERAGLAERAAKPRPAAAAAAYASATGAAPTQGVFDPVKVREAVARQLASDVLAGKLEQDQADQISSALSKLGSEGGAAKGRSSLDSVLRLLTAPSDGSSRVAPAGAAAGGTDTAQYLTDILSRGVYRTTA